MRLFQYAGRSGIQLDICGGHGIWFDPDELAHAMTFVRSGGLEAALREREPRQYRTDDRYPGFTGGGFRRDLFFLGLAIDLLDLFF